ncbi:MAG: hypothetical protein FJX04_04480 [Alphaproteobacteria bacterium]|nr:hypothetical protein [Alphaproteobacteria bacterium]
MPSFDFTQPQTFINTLEQFSLALHGVMVALRDEVNFGETRDETILNAALLCSLLEDTQSEANALLEKLERREVSD